MMTNKYFSSSHDGYLQIMQQHYAEASQGFYVACMLMTAFILLVSMTLQRQVMAMEIERQVAAEQSALIEEKKNELVITEITTIPSRERRETSNVVVEEVIEPKKTRNEESDTEEIKLIQTPVVREEVIEEIVDYKYDTFTISSSVLGSSGLTGEQVDELLRGTPLQGIGHAVIQIEKEYDINAYYTIAVSTLESGYGRSGLAKLNNNIFGLMIDKTFVDFNDCVYYFGRLMERYETAYEVTMTPEGINPTYCELSDWGKKVTTLMNQYVTVANQLY